MKVSHKVSWLGVSCNKDCVCSGLIRYNVILVIVLAELLERLQYSYMIIDCIIEDINTVLILSDLMYLTQL